MHRCFRIFSSMIGPVAALTIAGGALAQSVGVPTLNVDPVCHGIAQQAATPGEIGDPDLSFRRCVRSEIAMRQRLARKWATYTSDEKATCIGSETGGFASYSDLATCLQMAKRARRFKQ